MVTTYCILMRGEIVYGTQDTYVEREVLRDFFFVCEVL